MIFKGIAKKIITYMNKRKICNLAGVGNNVSFALGSHVKNSGPKENVIIDGNSFIGAYLYALYGGKIHIGEHTYIGSGTKIYAKQDIFIGECVIISNDVIIMDNNSHPISPEAREKMSRSDDFFGDLWTWQYADSKPVLIESNVWIGLRAMIMKGVHIGRGAVVAAGSVVVHDVPANTIVAGNPAVVVKVIKKYEK